MSYSFWVSIIYFFITIISCVENNSESSFSVRYNIIHPGNGIYLITEKDVAKEKTINNYFEQVHYLDDKIMKIERYNTEGELTDNLSVPAITKLYYNTDDQVKYLKYFDKDGKNSEDEEFGYWSIEYIYDEENRVKMEIYRNTESKFLKVPKDNSGNIAKVNFLAPILTYEYSGDKLKIKALDQNFNLLKEVIGEKPCVPFIDCGESEINTL